MRMRHPARLLPWAGQPNAHASPRTLAALGGATKCACATLHACCPGQGIQMRMRHPRTLAALSGVTKHASRPASFCPGRGNQTCKPPGALAALGVVAITTGKSNWLENQSGLLVLGCTALFQCRPCLIELVLQSSSETHCCLWYSLWASAAPNCAGT